jgi:hypothetical protein
MRFAFDPISFLGKIAMGSIPLPSQFDAVAHGANLSGTVNPVTVTLTIGDDTGAVSVNSFIVH